MPSILDYNYINFILNYLTEMPSILDYSYINFCLNYLTEMPSILESVCSSSVLFHSQDISAAVGRRQIATLHVNMCLRLRQNVSFASAVLLYCTRRRLDIFLSDQSTLWCFQRLISLSSFLSLYDLRRLGGGVKVDEVERGFLLPLRPKQESHQFCS
jgi:hypothetical protein